jgi:putative transposase
LKLHLRRKGKKRLPTRHPEKLAVPAAANLRWSVNFMSDALMSGQRFRTFNVLDDFNREALAIEVDTALPAARVVRVLERVVAWRGCPAKLRMKMDRNLCSWPWQIGLKTRSGSGVHPAGQANTELVYRKIQPHLPP